MTSFASTDGGAYTFVYDELKRPTSQTWTSAGTAYTTTFHYNRAGCLDSVKYPTGTTLTLTCDTLNRTTSAKIGTSVIANNVSYHPDGRVAQLTYGNGKSTSTTFTNGRVTAMTSTGVLGLSYGYDGADNITSYSNSAVPGSSRTMAYDKLDRLETSTAPNLWGTAVYQYDELGNRSLKSSGSQTTNYTHDANNRLVFSTGEHALNPVTLTWNKAGGLASSSDGTTYLYDGYGRRVRRTQGAQTSLYHYDPAGQLLAETLPTGEKIREYFYLGGKLIAVDGCLDGVSTGCTERQWYHTDLLGSVLARSDAAGSVVARFEYEPWGEPWSSSGVQGSRQYNGRVLDSATGLYDYGARTYAPALGRFISKDPAWASVIHPQTANPYAYVVNNPYKYTDPSGRIPFLIVTAGVGALIGAGSGAIISYVNTGEVSWSAVATGAVAGGVIGAGGGALAAWGLTGSATASTGLVVGVGQMELAALLPTAKPLADQVSSALRRGGSNMTFYTRQDVAPALGRNLSTAYGEGAEALAAAARPGGTLYRADIPKALITILENNKLATQITTNMKGTATTAIEYEFKPGASEFIVKYFQAVSTK